MTTALYSASECRMHDMGAGHPECPQRLEAIANHLHNSGLHTKLVVRESSEATIEQIARAHDREYVGQIIQIMEDSRTSGRSRPVDPDTVCAPGTHRAALLAAGAAIAATDAVIKGDVKSAFCAIRPPGHHATRTEAMGFCFFNNVAIAARHALDVHGLERVAIVDFDVHHGNGTEDIVAGDERILMASFFQFPLYPNSGVESKASNLLNVPVSADSDGTRIREVFETILLPRLYDFRPEMVFISAGFDAHYDDPLAQLNLVEADYVWITAQLKRLADLHAQGRIVSCLEGGYALDALGRSVVAHIRELASEPQ